MNDGPSYGAVDARASEAKAYQAARVPHSLAGASAGMGIAGNSAIDKSSTPVRDTIGGLEQLLSELHSTIDGLEGRFDTILTPVPPSPVRTDETRRPDRVQSHLQGRLGILAEGYQAAIVRLHMIADRIEL